MACERYQGALSDVAAGAPAPAELEAHLASCAGCREDLATLRKALAQADSELQSLLSAQPSPGLEARIRSAAAAAEPSGWLRPAWLWPALATATVLAIGLALVMGRTPDREPAVAALASPPPPAAAGAETTAEASQPRGPAAAVSGPERGLGAPAPRGRGASEPRPVSRPSTASSEPEVLVPPGEAEALLRFAAGLARRSVTPGSFLVADLSLPLPEPTLAELRPLEIAPLTPGDDSGTD